MLSFENGEGAVIVIRVYGDLAFENADGLTSALRAVDRMDTCAVVDLAGCPYVDSAALAALIRGHQALDGRLNIVVEPNTHVSRTMRVTGLAQTLPLSPSVAEAMNALRKHMPFKSR